MMAMTAVPAETSNRSGLVFKLGLLFTAALVAVVAAGILLNLFSGLLANQKAQADMAVQQPAVVIDPKLESDLAKVINLEDSQNSADLKDPFIDRGGISQLSNNQTGAAARNSTTAVAVNAGTADTKTAAAAATKTSTGQTAAGSADANKIVVKEDTTTRILRRDENIRNGLPVPPESEMFAIEDLLPVGVVSGGNGQEEILLYSQSADRTFSYPVGTRFYDGWLSGIRGEGAVFSFNETREIRLKSWVRSIQPRTAVN